MDCSFMQEIAEYPLILVYLVLWHYRLTGDRQYLEENYPKVRKLLDAYRAQYEKDGLLREDATTTFEGWGKDSKSNASLFHLTMSDAAVFMADIDLENLFA